jgi:hypothetical protein
MKNNYRAQTQVVPQPIVAHTQTPVAQIKLPEQDNIVLQTIKTKNINPSNNKSKRIKRRITKTMKYKLGKQGKSVSVLIKNNSTRKKVQHELGLLKQKNIGEVKNYLRDKNLLKAGSSVPPDVARVIYENAILAGDVENKSKETLIHNFMSK